MSLRAASWNSRSIGSISRARTRFHSAVRGALTDIGKKNVGTARALILSRKKTGKTRVVTVRGRRVRHRASAPGEAPANLSGVLQQSIRFIVHGSNSMEFGADAPYAAFLEEGTKRMAKRPYLITTVQRNDGYAYNRLSGYVLAELIA